MVFLVARLSLAQQPDQAVVSELVDALIYIVDSRFLHGHSLFFRDRRIRVDPEHEGIEGIDEVLNVSHAHIRAELLQQHAHEMHGMPIGLFESIQLAVTFQALLFSSHITHHCA